MIDEIYDRHYREGRNELNAAILGAVSRFTNAFGNAFAVLNRIEYSAPWTAKRTKARCN